MQCPSCQSENPPLARFCCSCAQPLDQASRAFRDDLDRTVSAKLDELLRAKYKDQKLVDVETTELVVARVQSWAKLFAFFVGVPLFLILALFGGLGYHKYTDLVEGINKIETTQLSELKGRAEKVKLTLDELSNKVDTIDSIQKAADKHAGLRLVAVKVSDSRPIAEPKGAKVLTPEK
jgi:hypothetical protein